MKRVFVLLVALSLTLGSNPASAAPRALWPVRGVILRLPAIPWPNWKPGHRGIDIAADPSTPVLSPASGRVVWVGVVADLPSISVVAAGLKYTMQPVTSSLLKGDWVDRGQVIGEVDISDHCGATSCLHWSVRRGSDYLDPRWFAEPLLRRGSPR